MACVVHVVFDMENIISTISSTIRALFGVLAIAIQRGGDLAPVLDAVWRARHPNRFPARQRNYWQVGDVVTFRVMPAQSLELSALPTAETVLVNPDPDDCTVNLRAAN